MYLSRATLSQIRQVVIFRTGWLIIGDYDHTTTLFWSNEMIS